MGEGFFHITLPGPKKLSDFFTFYGTYWFVKYKGPSRNTALPFSCGVFQNPFQFKKNLIEKGCVMFKFVITSWGLGLKGVKSSFCFSHWYDFEFKMKEWTLPSKNFHYSNNHPKSSVFFFPVSLLVRSWFFSRNGGSIQSELIIILGGWWYNACYSVNLNNLNKGPNCGHSQFCMSWKSAPSTALKSTKMAIRPQWHIA